MDMKNLVAPLTERCIATSGTIRPKQIANYTVVILFGGIYFF